MSSEVVVVDYGLGNLASVERALRHIGADVVISDNPVVLADCPRAVLPGVGAFGTAIQNLRDRGLMDPLLAFAGTGRPLLGICLGMQLFMDESDEGGTHAGLGLIPGRVARLPQNPGIKVPHVGWNKIAVDVRDWSGTVLNGLAPEPALYFVHSYYVAPDRSEDTLGITRYGGFSYCSVVQRANVVGCQAHPEKSGSAGLKILENFLSMRPS